MNRMIVNFEKFFTCFKGEVNEYQQIDDTGLLVKLNNGESILYDDVDNTFRCLPRDSIHMSKQECLDEFGIRLRRIMKRKGLTQREVCKAMNMDEGNFSRYANGERAPSFYIADKIAKTVGCSLDDLRYIE